MTRARNRGLPVLRVLVLFGVGGVWAVACGGPQPLGGAGSVCFRADECQAGLACVPETMGAAKHVCSADLSGIVSMVDGAPPDGDVPDEAGGSPAMVQGGSPADGGKSSSAGASGKPSTGGAPGTGGKPGTATAGSSAGGSSAAGSSASGGPAAGGPGGGSSAGGSASGGAENGGASGGAGG